MSRTAELKNQIDLKQLPQHIAVIMDGNGRWAKKRSMPRVFGHKNGVESVRQIAEHSARLGIEYVSLYAFSTENWNRPQIEVNALMGLLVETIKREIKTLQENKIRLNAIGDIEKLPAATQKALLGAIADTAKNDKMTLTLALNYSGKWDLLNAVKTMYRKDIQPSEENMAMHLSTYGMPDPELMIRTSGEKRISNYFLWQLAYTELYFTDVFWPDFREEHLYEAILTYQNRERRFGKISEQL